VKSGVTATKLLHASTNATVSDVNDLYKFFAARIYIDRTPQLRL